MVIYNSSCFEPAFLPLPGVRRASSAGSRSRPRGQSADSPWSTLQTAPFSDLPLRHLLMRKSVIKQSMHFVAKSHTLSMISKGRSVMDSQ